MGGHPTTAVRSRALQMEPSVFFFFPHYPCHPLVVGRREDRWGRVVRRAVLPLMVFLVACVYVCSLVAMWFLCGSVLSYSHLFFFEDVRSLYPWAPAATLCVRVLGGSLCCGASRLWHCVWYRL